MGRGGPPASWACGHLELSPSSKTTTQVSLTAEQGRVCQLHFASIGCLVANVSYQVQLLMLHDTSPKP